MKTPHDPRHHIRARAMQALFTWDFQKDQMPADQIASEIVKHLEEIDREIGNAAPERPINQINRTDLAILRLAVFELIIKKDVPYKVSVDEAVELGKEFGGESSPSFINGVLGKIITAHGLDQKKGEME